MHYIHCLNGKKWRFRRQCQSPCRWFFCAPQGAASSVKSCLISHQHTQPQPQTISVGCLYVCGLILPRVYANVSINPQCIPRDKRCLEKFSWSAQDFVESFEIFYPSMWLCMYVGDLILLAALYRCMRVLGFSLSFLCRGCTLLYMR